MIEYRHRAGDIPCRDPRRRGKISSEAEQHLHRELTRLVRLRNAFEVEMTDPNYRMFRPVKRPADGSLRIGPGLTEATCLFDAGINLIAQLIGDEAILSVQTRFAPAQVVPKHERSKQLLRLAPFLPDGEIRLAKHKLVALMWQAAKILAGRNRKGAKGEVGDAYGLGKDAISKWYPACRNVLGRNTRRMLDVAENIPEEWLYALVFGSECGKKTLQECAEAYRACRDALGRSSRRGRPREIPSN